jgi:hypothetical protein
MHKDYMATPIFNAVAAITPYPVLTVDTSFTWKGPNRAPKVGAKPKRNKRR